MRVVLDKAVGNGKGTRHAWKDNQRGVRRKRKAAPGSSPDADGLWRRVDALLSLITDIYGPDRLVLKAGRLGALKQLRSRRPTQRLVALQKLVFENPTIEGPPRGEDIPRVLEEIEEEIADILARRSVEDNIEKKIAAKMQERQEEYLKELKMQIIKEDAGPENPQTLKRYAHLEKMESTRLARSAIEMVRPGSLDEIVAQEGAIKALLAKIASPYPQHVLLYGPPGIGKTTVARLALEEAKKLPHTPFGKDAAFVEVDGTTLRWDPREITNPLLGSVHDPIYQGARRELAEGGVPEPKLGLVTEAHGGVLFIDEIGELDPMLQHKLLKVLEDKRVMYDSSYYDPSDPNVPRYVKKLFEEGAPADFVLIGATTREPEDISPALRSRCAEVFFDPLTPADIRRIAANAARKLKVRITPRALDVISEYTSEGRKAVSLLADAYGLALYRYHEKGQATDRVFISVADLYEVIRTSRLTPNIYHRASRSGEVGRAFALGVYGHVGSVVEIEAVAFPAREQGKGSLRFNETAGSMARDSVFNVTSVLRRLTGEDVADYDLHVNIVGGGRIDGPSAGLAIFLALMSAVQNRPLRQDVAFTGEISIQGKVKAVGGLHEKIYGARQAGMKKVIIPADNAKDMPRGFKGMALITVRTVEEAVAYAFCPPAARPSSGGRG